MKKVIFLLLIVFLFSFSLVVAQSSPPNPNAFYGSAKYTDGQSIPDGFTITTELNGLQSGSTVIKSGQYGFGADALIVLDYARTGGTVKFYINGKKANQESLFHSLAVTSLNLTVASPPTTFIGCGDGIIGSGEQCDGSVGINNNSCSIALGSAYGGNLACSSLCKIDTSLCSLNFVPAPSGGGSSSSSSSGGGGGSSGSGSGTSSSKLANNLSNNDKIILTSGENNFDPRLIVNNPNEKDAGGLSAITGAVVGALGGTKLLAILIFGAILVVGFIIVNVRKSGIKKRK